MHDGKHILIVWSVDHEAEWNKYNTAHDPVMGAQCTAINRGEKHRDGAMWTVLMKGLEHEH